MARNIENPGTRTLLAGAAVVVAAGLVTWLIYGMMAQYQGELEEARVSRRMIEVVQAAIELEPGTAIKREDLATMMVPEGSVPEAQIFTRDQMGDAVGSIPAERVFAGETLRRERMDVRAVRAALDRIIAPGARAATVLVDAAAGMAGLLRPSDRIDVIVTIRPDSDAAKADWVTETILQNVRVLAIDRAVIGGKNTEEGDDKKNDKKRSSTNRKILVTLEVLPDEAEKLALATTRGDLQLSLRGAMDDSILEDHGPLVTNTMVGIGKASEAVRSTGGTRTKSPAPSPIAEPPRTSTMEVISGEKRSTSTYDGKGAPVGTSGASGR